MPQLDKAAFISELYVLIIVLCVIYFLMSFIILPIIYRNIYVKNKLFYVNNLLLTKLSSIYNTICKKDVFAPVSVFMSALNILNNSVSFFHLAQKKYYNPFFYIGGVWCNADYLIVWCLLNPTHYIYISLYFNKDKRKKFNKIRVKPFWCAYIYMFLTTTCAFK